MEDNSNQCLGKISLQDLISEDGGELSPEKLEEFLHEVIDLSAEKHEARPDALVKVVYNGELLVLTQEQADHLLQDPLYLGESLAGLRSAVERALKGDAACIRQELLILIMMARMTLDQFKKDNRINTMEIVRQYPLLDRTEKEAKQILREIEEMSERIHIRRSQHPIISDYETKVGQMLALQQSADLHGAKRIALELQSKKKHYLFCCKALEPDVIGIQYRRMDLQKIKKRVLSIHKYLLEQTVDGIQVELDSIKEKIKLLSSGQCANSSTDAADSNRSSDNHLDELEKLLKKLEERENELNSAKKQNTFFTQDESKIDSVITEISTNILNVHNNPDLSEKISELEAQRKLRKTPDKTNEPKHARMVTLTRRRS